jgi:hypothetical protein
MFVFFLICLFFYFVCSVFLCTLSPRAYSCLFLFVFKFTDHCQRVETRLQLTNITSYHVRTNYDLHSTDISIVVLN